jgi:NAD(P)-dependent dehydrogenase (short-subunit alcohol dehydrogenase family)
MDLKLAGKVAVVTGAGSGIGHAATRALVEEGAFVVAGSRSTENIDGLERVTAVALDLATHDGPARLIQRAIDEHARIDVLVNNDGAAHVRLEGFLATTDQDFEWAMQMNFYIALRATRAALAHMVEQGEGALVTSAVGTPRSSSREQAGLRDLTPGSGKLRWRCEADLVSGKPPGAMCECDWPKAPMVGRLAAGLRGHARAPGPRTRGGRPGRWRDRRPEPSDPRVSPARASAAHGA